MIRPTGGGAPVAIATHYLYDSQGHLIGEYDGTGAPLREYAYLGELPLALIEPDGALSFIHTDHLDTPRVVVNAQNQPVWRWDAAEPFGDTPPQDNPANLGAFEFNLRFPGQYFDKETNLHYNGFRDYDPQIGRYVQSDPVGLRGGLNTYAYVGSNPLSRADPLGLFVITGTGTVQVSVMVGPVGASAGVGGVVGTDKQICEVFQFCPRFGFGFFAGIGLNAGISAGSGGTANAGGISVGVGGDIGLGPSVGGQVMVGVNSPSIAARVKVVVASVMQPTAEYRCQPNAT